MKDVAVSVGWTGKGFSKVLQRLSRIHSLVLILVLVDGVVANTARRLIISTPAYEYSEECATICAFLNSINNSHSHAKHTLSKV